MLCPHCHLEHPPATVLCPKTGRSLPTLLEPGTFLDDKYRIVGYIASGGMGSVYAAEHTLIGKQMAVKLLLPDVARSEDMTERFRREARAASAIGHENIVEVTDLGRARDGTPFIVMELLRGQSLGSLLAAERRLRPPRATHIARQVLSALSAAHARGILHRDLKPENIFISLLHGDPDFVKILDFGISKILESAAEAQSLASTGFVLGTPFYVAPEQARGERDIDHRVDIYAVGAILYQMVTGVLPYQAPNFNALMFQIAQGRAVPPRNHNPEIPVDLEDVILRAMTPDRDRRFTSADEFLAALSPGGSAGADKKTIVVGSMGAPAGSSLTAELSRLQFVTSPPPPPGQPPDMGQAGMPLPAGQYPPQPQAPYYPPPAQPAVAPAQQPWGTPQVQPAIPAGMSGSTPWPGPAQPQSGTPPWTPVATSAPPAASVMQGTPVPVPLPVSTPLPSAPAHGKMGTLCLTPDDGQAGVASAAARGGSTAPLATPGGSMRDGSPGKGKTLFLDGPGVLAPPPAVAPPMPPESPPLTAPPMPDAGGAPPWGQGLGPMPPHPTDKAGPAPAAVAGPNIKRLLIPALIAGVVVGGGAGAAILLTRPPKPPARVRVDAAAVAPRPAADAAPATASPADAAGPAPADGAAAAAELVHIQFHVVPARAKIFVDGQLLEGGNKLDVPRSTAARKVRFEADGYHQKEIDLVPDYDQDLAIDLIAKAAPAAASDRSQPTAKPPVVVEKPPVGKPPVVAKPPVAKPPVIAKPKTGPAKTGKSKKPRIFTKI